MFDTIKVTFAVNRERAFAEEAWKFWSALINKGKLNISDDFSRYGNNLFRDFAAIKAYCMIGDSLFSGQEQKLKTMKKQMRMILDMIESDLCYRVGGKEMNWMVFFGEITSILENPLKEASPFESIKTISSGNILETFQVYITETKDFFEYRPNDWPDALARLIRQMAVVFCLVSKSLEARVIYSCV